MIIGFFKLLEIKGGMRNQLNFI